MRNPYDFVRIDWDKGVARRPPSFHDRFEGLSGRIEGTITTLTPFFIPQHDKSRISRPDRKLFLTPFLTNRSGQAIIPGSSLKGMIRSLVETVGYGCWWLFKGEYSAKGKGRKVYYELPEPFQQCPRGENLCVACRMFGLIRGDTLLQGHVGFNDAVCTKLVEQEPIYTIILSTPKPRHTPFYLDQQGDLAGRKFYLHHSTPPRDKGKWAVSKEGERQNQYIKPIDADSVFTFSAHFDDLAPDELRLLLYALVLEDGMRHKLGYGKPAGLGSVHIELTRLEMIDYQQRYTAPDGGKVIYEGEQLASYVADQTAFYKDQENVTLRDLRRIWGWPGYDDISYPSWQWFQDPENKRKRLDEIE